MMHTLKNASSAKLRRLAALLVTGLLAGCDDHAGDPIMQIGANAVLPALQPYLMPPMRVAQVVGWDKETPAVPEGLAGSRTGDRLPASALSLRPAQWRRAGGREQ
jgi:hypothetical protein